MRLMILCHGSLRRLHRLWLKQPVPWELSASWTPGWSCIASTVTPHMWIPYNHTYRLLVSLAFLEPKTSPFNNCHRLNCRWIVILMFMRAGDWCWCSYCVKSKLKSWKFSKTCNEIKKCNLYGSLHFSIKLNKFKNQSCIIKKVRMKCLLIRWKL